MDPDLSCLDLSQQPGDILIILALRLGQLRIFSYALDTLPASDLDAV